MIKSVIRRADHCLVLDGPNSLRQQNEVLEAWQSIRSVNSNLRSPYFSPQFAAAILEAGLKIEIAVQRRQGEIVAIWPFQRKSRSIAAPIGGGLNDSHGVIIEPDTTPDWPSLLDLGRITRYDFHSAPKNQVQEFALGSEPSFAVNLSNLDENYEAYLSSRRYTIRRQPQKTRKLARALGPLRLEFDCRDPKLLETILNWKSQHYRRTNILDIFEIPWVRKLMFNLHAAPSDLRGQLSVLFAGSTPVAGHFGIREGDLLHYWYPTYDQRQRATSPGTQLFLEIANAAPKHGVNVIDFGYGDQAYKQILCNSRTESKTGTVTYSPVSKISFLAAAAARKMVKKLWFKEQGKALVRCIVPQLGRRHFSASVNDSMQAGSAD